MGQIVEPSVTNRGAVRAVTTLLAVVAGGWGAGALPRTVAAGVHLAAAAIWVGVNVWVTFIAGIVMFRNLPRQTFGKLQAKLFPLYFALISVCCAVLLGTTTWGPLAAVASAKVQNTLWLGLVTAFSNFLFIEPKATALLFKRYDLENSGRSNVESERKTLTKAFGKLHGLSSLANLGNLAAAAAHLVWLATLIAV